MNRYNKIYFSIICIVWLVLRLGNLGSTGDPQWERDEAVKLNEYGWSATNGGIMNWHYMYGRINNPQDHLYINHPPGMIWFYSVFIKFFGDKYIMLFPVLFSFVGLLTLFIVSSKYFGNLAGLFTVIVYTFLPVTLFLDTAINIIPTSLTFWFLIVILTMLWMQSGQQKYYYILLPTCLLACQIDWVSFLLFPFILFGVRLSSPVTYRRKYYLMVLFLFALPGIVYAFQIIYYTNDWERLLIYVRRQSAGGPVLDHDLGLQELLTKILTKLIVYLHPLILLSSFVGLYLLIKERNLQQFYLLLAVGGPCILLMVFFSRFLYIEIPPYKLFAGAVSLISGYVSGRVFQSSRKALLKATTGLFFILFIISSVLLHSSLEERHKQRSIVSPKIAEQLVKYSTSGEIILTNLQEQAFPFPSWEAGGWLYTSFYADRFIRFGVTSKTRLGKILDDVKTDSCLYVYVPEALEIERDLSLQLTVKSRQVAHVGIVADEKIHLSPPFSFLQDLSNELHLPSNKVLSEGNRTVQFQLIIYRVQK
jgi:4-amino-4-deoxy-L-arabinose transferase-like glycosyltransferase